MGSGISIVDNRNPNFHPKSNERITLSKEEIVKDKTRKKSVESKDISAKVKRQTNALKRKSRYPDTAQVDKSTCVPMVAREGKRYPEFEKCLKTLRHSVSVTEDCKGINKLKRQLTIEGEGSKSS